MTETTDIASLREEVEQLREELLVERNAAINLSNHLSDCAVKLKEERQRADDEKALNKHLELSIRQSEVVNAKLRERAEKAELELIKPLPIGELIQRLEGQTYEKWFSESDLKGEKAPILPEPISITDVIQKVDTEQNAKWNGRIGFMAGWNACRDAAISSGYRIPLQKPCINKEKLCDWLEDNFDIDDSQRDAFATCFAHCCDCIVKDGQS